jgi:hypothetical protein
MADETLHQFVKEALAAGKSRADISKALRAAGWNDDQAREALASFADVDFPVPVPRPRAYGSAREAFLYIVYFVLLGMVAGYIGRLSFGWIEYLFKDELVPEYLQIGTRGLRWGIASLVVGYPIFLYLGARLGAARRKNPERRTSRIRSWLTYITLIFAAVTLIGDLVAVVYQFLAGEIGARFMAKAGVVAIISGAILWNYSRDAERTDAGADMPGRILAIITSVIVAVLIVWAFTVVRSPQAARAQLADEQRLQDLGTITRLVDCHLTYFEETPADLETMAARLSERSAESPVAVGCGATLPYDPSTGAPYRYEKLDGERYRLCAAFQRGWPEDERDVPEETRSLGTQYGIYRKDRYVTLPEGPGETCFEFEAANFERKKEEEE